MHGNDFFEKNYYYAITFYSGIIKDPKRGNFEQSLMLRANSGSALLYFYSDKLYNEKGFKIKYRWVAISSVIF